MLRHQGPSSRGGGGFERKGLERATGIKQVRSTPKEEAAGFNPIMGDGEGFAFEGSQWTYGR